MLRRRQIWRQASLCRRGRCARVTIKVIDIIRQLNYLHGWRQLAGNLLSRLIRRGFFHIKKEIMPKEGS
jgi:hypothetical protein